MFFCFFSLSNLIQKGPLFLLKGSAQIENGHNQNMLPRETSKPLENMNPALLHYYNFKLKFISFEFVALVEANQLKLQILSSA